MPSRHRRMWRPAYMFSAPAGGVLIAPADLPIASHNRCGSYTSAHPLRMRGRTAGFRAWRRQRCAISSQEDTGSRSAPLILGDRAHWRRMAAEAQEDVLQFASERVASALEGIYSEMITAAPEGHLRTAV
jgi:hypothetical protein